MTNETNPTTCIACLYDNAPATGINIENRYPLYTCPRCGLSWLDTTDENRPNTGFDDYWNEINEAIYTHPETVAELKEKYLRYFKLLNAPPNRKFLDVGSGAGICVDTADKCGFDAMGIEPSERGTALAKQSYQVNVVCDLLRADDPLPRDFGVLTLWDVIEHVDDPEALVSICRDHLENKGYFLLETPDEGTAVRGLVKLVSRLSGHDLRHNIYYRSHRYYFTRPAMQALLTRAGFADIRFYGQKTMYRKALLKSTLFHGASGLKKNLLRFTYGLLRLLPFTENKMVVIARKSSAG